MAWELSELVFDGVKFTTDEDVWGMQVSGDGTRMYLAENNTGHIKQYLLSTPYDVSSASLEHDKTGAGYIASDIYLSDDGLHYFEGGDDGSKYVIKMHTLSTPWDISTATYTGQGNLAQAGRSAFTFSTDGTKIYIVGNNTDLSQYDLGTAWDVTTAVYTGTDLDLPFESFTGMSASSDGTKFYLTEHVNDTVVQYDLGTAWDITTAAAGVSINTDNDAPYSSCFSPDGEHFYSVGIVPKSVEQWTVSGQALVPESHMIAFGRMVGDAYNEVVATLSGVGTLDAVCEPRIVKLVDFTLVQEITLSYKYIDFTFVQEIAKNPKGIVIERVNT